MSDFVSEFWSVYVAVIALAGIIGCAVLLKAMSTKRAAAGEKAADADITGHLWDENLAEWNNPLPRWWMWLFYITIVFALVYLALYPGLGSFNGILKWTSSGEYKDETQRAETSYGPIFNKFLKQDLPAAAKDAEARAMGQRLFLTYCASCHGSNARGSKGFPNLTDNDWLYGGDPKTIETSIRDGRSGVMPAWGPVLGEAGVKEVTHYVLSLSGSQHDAKLAAAGKEKFATVCAACHGPDGKGNQALGAPNLTDKIWLYGGSEASIIETITKGRNGQMPVWGEKLGEAKVHLLAAYVYGLSQEGQK